MEFAVGERVDRDLLPQVRAHGRRRRGVHRRADQALAERAAAHHAARPRRWRRRRTIRFSAGRPDRSISGARFPPHDDYRRPIQRGGHGRRRRPLPARRGEPLRRRLPRLEAQPDEPWQMTALEINLRVLGHDASVPGAAVPDRRPARSRHRAVPVAERPRQVLHGHRQPALGPAIAASCPRISSTSSPTTACTTVTGPSRACSST